MPAPMAISSFRKFPVISRYPSGRITWKTLRIQIQQLTERRERERELSQEEKSGIQKRRGGRKIKKERKHEEYYYCTWTVITNYAVVRFNGTSYESVNSYVTRRQRCDLIMWEFCHVFTDASLITSDSPFPWVMGPDTAEQSARFRVLKGKATSTVMSSSNSSSK